MKGPLSKLQVIKKGQGSEMISPTTQSFTAESHLKATRLQGSAQAVPLAPQGTL